MAEEKRLLKFVKVIGITAAVLVGPLLAALLLAIIVYPPSKNLVIVRHGTAYGDLGNDWAWTDMLYQFVSEWEE